MTNKLLCTITETAQMLSYSRDVIYQLIRDRQ